MKQTNLRTLIFCAMLAALGAVFSAYFSIEIPGFGGKVVEVSLTPVMVMLAGIFFGPLWGGMVGFVADTAGFFMGAQLGAYNPVFSITMALFGVIAGLFYLKSKKITWLKTILLVLVAQVVCSVVLNTLAIHLFYGVPLQALIPTRTVAAAIEVPIYVVLLYLLAKALAFIIKGEKNKSAN